MMQHPEVARAVKKEVCLMRRRYDLDIEEYRKQVRVWWWWWLAWIEID